ncbi:MAG: hypothetical protein U9Q81_12860 [Pseudomonadota bacterium]|nr:hypothetical protein [Pseudomonadota bacterium]
MKLPNASSAVVERKKVVEYLLARDHSSGRSKARFFTAVGFSTGQWQTLANALLEHARDGGVISTESSELGEKFVVEGSVMCPDGRHRRILSIWFVTVGQRSPRLVTAYPAGDNQ